MTVPSAPEARSLGTVTVTFNPDLEILEKQLRALPTGCVKVVVDNASRSELFAGVQALADRLTNVRVCRNETNLGLAAALNQGAWSLSELATPPRFVLLLDQDSEPQPGSIETLLMAFQQLEVAGHAVGCVGPLLRDPDTGITHGFHVQSRWRWRRVYPREGTATPVQCTNLNGSGTLTPLALFSRLGGLDESFFIDHVDTEWAFRVLDAGFGLWGVPGAVFVHRMGNTGLRFWWLGWRVWPSRSPVRHYYLFRNAVRLMRRPYVPTVWKSWGSLKLAMTALVHGFLGPERCSQLRNMWRGVRDGMRATRTRCGDHGCDAP